MNKFLKKLERLFSVPYCKDRDYKREQTKKEVRQTIIKRHNGKCWLCGLIPRTLYVHHINPKGTSTEENLVPLCLLCHKWVHWMLYKHFNYKAIQYGSWV